MLNLQQNSKNALDKIPEMFLNFKHISYKVTFFNLQKVACFHFYPTHLVNTKTTTHLRVGEQRWIYTSTLRVSVCTTIYLPFGG